MYMMYLFAHSSLGNKGPQHTLVYVWQLSNSERLAKNLFEQTEGGWISYYLLF